MSREYRVEVKVKNNIIYSKIKEAGFETVKEFCEKFNLPYAPVGQLILMKIRPVKNTIKETSGSVKSIWLPVVVKLAAALSVQPEELFTDMQLNVTENRTKVVEIGEEDVAAYLAMTQSLPQISAEDEVKRDEMMRLIDTALDSLGNEREKKVLRMRYGLGAEDGVTLQDAAEKLGVTRERVRQIEAKALRKLRHPCRKYLIKDLL